MPVYWGDLHNHCAVSYGSGTPSRTLANARNHLDFCSITGHAFWPDMPMDLQSQDSIIGMHFAGFAKLKYYWNDLIRVLDEANQPGKFVTFPSYEWHSMEFGDHNCYTIGSHLPLIDAPDPATIHRQLTGAGIDTILLPHHIGYGQGFRGANWDCFDSSRSPLVEIYSNHGSSEAEDSPYEYHHSMGPRVGRSMARNALTAGHRFGFYASTDSHDGYPGHYGHGRVGVIADRLDRPHVWEALKARRTIASTGANITGQVTLDGAGIGEITRHRSVMALRIDLEGTDTIDHLDLIEGGGSGWCVRQLPISDRHQQHPICGRYKIRIEMGWGRRNIPSLWDVEATILHGRLLKATPYFRASGQPTRDDQPANRITLSNDRSVQWSCRTMPNPAGGMGGTHFNAGGPQNIVLEIDGTMDTVLCVDTGFRELKLSLPELISGSVAEYVDGFDSPAIKVHRAVPEDEFTCHLQMDFRKTSPLHDFLYLRVRQSDGQMAWFSPIWYE